jgi:hypothetical protein
MAYPDRERTAGEMIYVKSVLFGVAGAIAAVVFWVVAAFVLPISIPILASKLANSPSGGIGAATIGSGSILLAAAVGFVSSSYWMFRRSSREKARP